MDPMLKYCLLCVSLGLLCGLITFTGMLVRTKIRNSGSKHKKLWDFVLSIGASLIISLLSLMFTYEVLLPFQSTLSAPPAPWIRFVCVMAPFILIGILSVLCFTPKWKTLPEDKPIEYIDDGRQRIMVGNIEDERDFLNKL